MNSPKNGQSGTQAFGVQELLDQLKTDGVERGAREAEELVEQARTEALEIVDAARREADQILVQAQSEADRTLVQGRQHLQLALRDAKLRLREELTAQYRGKLGQLVGRTLGNRQFLESLIRDLAQAAVTSDAVHKWRWLRAEGDALEAELPDAAAGPDALDEFAADVAAELLGDGVTLGATSQEGAGMRIRLVDRDVEIELTDEALEALLMQFLAPRFRALLNSERH